MFVHRPDASLFTLGFGRGPQTLLALGGWIGSGEVWHDLFGHLPGWRCVSYDHRGSGASECAPESITVDAMVDDLIAVADEVADGQRIGRCVLAAESAGAGIALQAVLAYPGRFSGLLLVGAGWRRPPPGAFDPFIAALEADYEKALGDFVDNCLPEPGSEDLRRWGRHILRRAPLPHAIELLRCRQALTVEAHLKQIRIRTLVVHGSLDRIAPVDDSRMLARELPDAELHVLEGLGHVPIVSAPAAVAQLVEARFGAGAPG